MNENEREDIRQTVWVATSLFYQFEEDPHLQTIAMR